MNFLSIQINVDRPVDDNIEDVYTIEVDRWLRKVLRLICGIGMNILDVDMFNTAATIIVDTIVILSTSIDVYGKDYSRCNNSVDS